MKNFIYFLLAAALLPCASSLEARNVETLNCLTANRTLTGTDELHLTSESTPFLSSVTVDLQSPDAWLFIEGIRPNEVVADLGDHILIEGQPLQDSINARIAIYRTGTIVMAHPSTYLPLQLYTDYGQQGDSQQMGRNTFYTNQPGEYVPDSLQAELKVEGARSMVLKRGYSATLATQPDGMGYSRVFIADTADLVLDSLPELLDGRVKFARVRQWEYVSKKGWAGSYWSAAPNGLKYVTEQSDLTFSTWYYNWGSDPSSTENPSRTYKNHNQEFVPEKWGSGGDPTRLYTLNDVSHLMGYNEPDHTEQSNVSVETAIEEWPILLQTGLRLGSPATTSFEWLYSFMSECNKNNYRVDYVVIHAYWGGLTAQEWYDKLKTVHDRTGRPIWIKEWNNGANWTNESWPSGTDNQYAKQLRDLQAILEVLDTCSFIERYSIYNWVEEKRSIISYEDHELTPAGEYYAANNPDYFFSHDKEVMPTWTQRSTPSITQGKVLDNGQFQVFWSQENDEFETDYSIEYSIDGSSFTEDQRIAAPATEATLDMSSWAYPGIGQVRITAHSPYGDDRSSDATYLYLQDNAEAGIAIDEVFGYGSWGHASFSQPTSDPVAIVGTLTYRNKMPLGFSLNNLDQQSWQLRLQAWDYQEDPTFANPDTVATFTISAGEYDFGGLQAVAGTMEAVGQDWKYVSFPSSFSLVPVVLANRTSASTSMHAEASVRNVTTQGFEIRLMVEEANQDSLLSETISYLAIEPGKGEVNGLPLSVGLSPEGAVADQLSGGYTLQYDMDSQTEMPLLFAAMQTASDSITTNLRILSRNATEATLMRSREVSASRTRPQGEQVGWMAIGRSNVSTPVETTLADVQQNGVKVYSLNGTLLATFRSRSNVNLSTLPRGTYLVQEGTQPAQKVIR